MINEYKVKGSYSPEKLDNYFLDDECKFIKRPKKQTQPSRYQYIKKEQPK